MEKAGPERGSFVWTRASICESWATVEPQKIEITMLSLKKGSGQNSSAVLTAQGWDPIKRRVQRVRRNLEMGTS